MFHKTKVLCTHPGCVQEATTKIACPWTYHRFSELKTYGFACPDHVNEVLDGAESDSARPFSARENASACSRRTTWKLIAEGGETVL